MADTKISALAAVTDVLDTDEFVLARSGATKKIDGVDLRAELGGALTYVEDTLGADVAMATNSVYYDGPEVTLSEGTWLLVGHILYDGNNNSTLFAAKLWDGSTVTASSQAFVTTGNPRFQPLSLVGIAVVASGTPTWKISVTANGDSTTLKAAGPNTGAGDNASRLVAVRIA